MSTGTNARVALVTGSGTRVGRVIAMALAEAGYGLLVHYASSEEGAREVVEAAQARGLPAEAVRANLLERDEIGRLAAEARRFGGGRLDLLVHNAANFERVPPEKLDEGSWDRAMALNATAPYLLTLALAPELRAARGCVVGLGCVSAERPWKNFLPYSTSKAALVHALKGLALALAPEVRVNVVSPGMVQPPDAYDEGLLERLQAKIPLARLGTAEDVAQAVLFFAQNQFVTGQVLAVDGGRSLA
ncbi:SDR family oxidoreductase [Polyangium aurulentum]|uniref:SDR family oxidoreductase n=1 Tax=Polyangium aurulentum TaxID=2567896 RepID=UPI0010AE76F6|nr:SDR family oxidoreductase [Polyangium aurulentum]UQA55761.1 SDR family oxidoreductase [Polyangium aurulentum]